MREPTTFNEAAQAFAADVRAGNYADRDERAAQADVLIERHIERTGDRPDGAALATLADALLHEELADRHPDKMAREEYPFMSESQLGRRHYAEVGAEQASEYDTQRQFRGVREKRRRSKYENTLADRYTASRNRERRSTYRAFTKTQPVRAYKLRKFGD